MKIYRGLPVSPGITIARIKKYSRVNLLDLIPVNCTSIDTSTEIFKINQALIEARKQLDNMRTSYTEKDLVDALESIVESIVQEALELVSNEGICSSLAVKKVYEKYAEILRSTGSQLFAFREVDLRVAAELLLKGILGQTTRELPVDYTNKIVVCEDLGITDFLNYLD